jgi:hypothetical protein
VADSVGLLHSRIRRPGRIREAFATNRGGRRDGPHPPARIPGRVSGGWAVSADGRLPSRSGGIVRSWPLEASGRIQSLARGRAGLAWKRARVFGLRRTRALARWLHATWSGPSAGGRPPRSKSSCRRRTTCLRGRARQTFIGDGCVRDAGRPCSAHASLIHAAARCAVARLSPSGRRRARWRTHARQSGCSRPRGSTRRGRARAGWRDRRGVR